MVEQLLEVFTLLDTQMPVEQVIAVPTISLDRIPQRLVERRLPQMVEQLMEVPTVLSPALLQQQTAEQPVDVPVPRGRGWRRLQGFLTEHRVQQRSPLSRSLTSLLVEVFKIYAQGRVQQLHPLTLLVLRMSFLQEGFALFPRGKKVRRSPARWV